MLLFILIVKKQHSYHLWCWDLQKIPRISRNPSVHYRTHKRPPPVSILGQPNPVHVPTSHLLEIRPNIIHPSTPRSPPWSLSLGFPHQDPIHPLSSPIRAIWLAHLILLDFITRTILGEEYRSLSSSLCSLLHSPVNGSNNSQRKTCNGIPTTSQYKVLACCPHWYCTITECVLCDNSLGISLQAGD